VSSAPNAYLDSLSAELARVGIRGGLRRRIVAEFADHLQSDPGADLGAPSALARQFADELGTTRALTAAFRSFGALALAGILFGATLLVTAALGGVGHANLSPAVTALLLACIVAGQVSFVAGGLGFLRAYRLRGETVIAEAEAVVLRRRAAVGLAAGALTLVALPVIVLAAPHVMSATWRVLAWVAAGVGIIAIVVASPSVLAATRVRPAAPGGAGDLFSDLGPLVPEPLRVAPWRFALVVAFGLGAVIAVVGVGADDPYDGVLRGLMEAAAVLAGFGLLGPYLGLRSETA
jgi:hypothetical protein